MAEKSVIYIFARDVESASGFMSPNRASTDAAGVVINWSASVGRSYQILQDQDDLLIAKLSYQEDDERAAADDLNRRCAAKGIKRETINESHVDKLRAVE